MYLVRGALVRSEYHSPIDVRGQVNIGHKSVSVLFLTRPRRGGMQRSALIIVMMSVRTVPHSPRPGRNILCQHFHGFLSGLSAFTAPVATARRPSGTKTDSVYR